MFFFFDFAGDIMKENVLQKEDIWFCSYTSPHLNAQTHLEYKKDGGKRKKKQQQSRISVV